MFNLSAILEYSSTTYPDHEALVFGDSRLTYSQLNGRANQVANALVEMGIGPGDKVGRESLSRVKSLVTCQVSSITRYF